MYEVKLSKQALGCCSLLLFGNVSWKLQKDMCSYIYNYSMSILMLFSRNTSFPWVDVHFSLQFKTTTGMCFLIEPLKPEMQLTNSLQCLTTKKL